MLEWEGGQKGGICSEGFQREGRQYALLRKKKETEVNKSNNYTTDKYSQKVMGPNMIKMFSWNVNGVGTCAQKAKSCKLYEIKGCGRAPEDASFGKKDKPTIHERWIKCACHNNFTKKNTQNRLMLW